MYVGSFPRRGTLTGVYRRSWKTDVFLQEPGLRRLCPICLVDARTKLRGGQRPNSDHTWQLLHFPTAQLSFARFCVVLVIFIQQRERRRLWKKDPVSLTAETARGRVFGGQKHPFFIFRPSLNGWDGCCTFCRGVSSGRWTLKSRSSFSSCALLRGP